MITNCNIHWSQVVLRSKNWSHQGSYPAWNLTWPLSLLLLMRSGSTQKENSPRVSACMFFQLLALSPSLRPVCFSSLSDLPSCPASVFPFSSPLRSLPQLTQPRPLRHCPSLPLPGQGSKETARLPSPFLLALKPFHLLMQTHKSAFSKSCLKNRSKHLLNL